MPVFVGVITIRLSGVAEPTGVVAVRVAVWEALVDLPITIIVEPITSFDGAWVDERVVVVAVAIAYRMAVTIAVGRSQVAHPVARVADLVDVRTDHFSASVDRLTSTVDTTLPLAADDVVAGIDGPARVARAIRPCAGRIRANARVVTRAQDSGLACGHDERDGHHGAEGLFRHNL
jgi:hypothetical protein